MPITLRPFALALALIPFLIPWGSACSAGQDTDGPVVYSAERIYVGDDRILDQGLLVVTEGTITAVGEADEVEVPAGAERVDLGTGVLMPGLVVAQSSLSGVGSDDEKTLTPQVRALDGFNRFGDYFSLLDSGITTVQLAPGNRRLMPGRGAVVKLGSGESDSDILIEAGALRIVLSTDSRRPPRIYEPPVGAVSIDRPLETTAPQLGLSLAEALAGLRAVFETAEDPNSWRDGDLSANRPEDAAMLEAIAACLELGTPLRVVAETAAEVRGAIELAREVGLKLILVGPTWVGTQEERNDRWDGVVQGVVLISQVEPGTISNTPVPDPDQPEPMSLGEMALALLEDDYPVALCSDDDDDLDELIYLTGLLTADGLSQVQALNLVTSGAAEVLGVGDRVGRLTPGHDADFLVLSDAPFAAQSRVESVYLSGRLVGQDRSRQSDDAEDRVQVLRAGRILDGLGGDFVGAELVIRDGKIRGVGANVSRPGDAEIRTFPDAVIVPGFLDLAVNLGLDGSVSSRVDLDVKLSERLVDFDRRLQQAYTGGVTTGLLASSGSSPSPVVAFKMGSPITVLNDPVAIQFSLTSGSSSAVSALKRVLSTGKTYAESWTKYETDLKDYQAKLAEYKKAKARYDAEVAKRKKALEAEAKKQADAEKNEDDNSEDEPNDEEGDQDGEGTSASTTTTNPLDQEEDEKPGDVSSEDQSGTDDEEKDEQGQESKADPTEGLTEPKEPQEPKKPRENAKLEPYRSLFAGEIPAMVKVEPLASIREAIQLFRDDFGLRTILVEADGLFREPEILTGTNLSVAVGPTFSVTSQRQRYNLPQILANQGVPTGFRSAASTGSGQLRGAITYTIRQGLGSEDALTGLTSSPAEFLGLDERVGAIESGRDADLVVLSGPPFDLSSRILAVMIDGRWVYNTTTKNSEMDR